MKPLLPALLALVLLVPGLASVDVPHLQLLRAEPAADTVLAESPAEIRLFFSEEPQMTGTTVRLADSDDELVPSSDAAPDTVDARQVVIVPVEPVPPGAYTVYWRAISQDGHAVRGDFGFQIRPE